MKTLLASAAVAALALAASAASAATFPPAGSDTGPGIIITYNANGSISTQSTGQGPYVTEDVYIGVINNSSKAVNALNVGSTVYAIGYFDGDGIDGYTGASNAVDTTGYGGPQSYFTNNNAYFGPGSLTVNFIGGLQPGASTYFSLEYPVTVQTLSVPEPATWALMLIGVAGVGYAARRRQAAVAA